MHLTPKQEATKPAAPSLLQQQARFDRRNVNLSQVFAGQPVGVRQVDEHIWLVSFMHYDLGYFDDETCRLEPIENPLGPILLPMSPE